MKVIIEISPEHYDAFLDKCDVSSAQYSILKNGVIALDKVDGRQQRMIKILCDEETAVLLFDSATRLYPEAAAAIAARTNYTSQL